MYIEINNVPIRCNTRAKYNGFEDTMAQRDVRNINFNNDVPEREMLP